MFSSLSSFSLSHLLSPLFRSKHHPPPNINITHHSGRNVDQRWRKRWSSDGSGSDVWVLIGVDMGFFFFFFSYCDQGWSAVSGLFRWDFGGWSGLINDGGNIDLVAAVFGFWSGLIWVVFFFFFFFYCDWGWSAVSRFMSSSAFIIGCGLGLLK